MASDIINKLGGEIGYLSNTNSKGSTFWIKLKFNRYSLENISDSFKDIHLQRIYLDLSHPTYEIISEYFSHSKIELKKYESKNQIKEDDHLITEKENNDLVCKKIVINENISQPIKLMRLLDDLKEKKIKKQIRNTKYVYLNILLVEDNLIVHKLEKKLLNEYGINNVYSAYNGEEGLEILKGNSIDLILLDYKMPKMNGLEFVDELKRIGKDIPIIMISGNTDEEFKVNCKERGIKNLLHKPIIISDLFVIIEKIFTKTMD